MLRRVPIPAVAVAVGALFATPPAARAQDSLELSLREALELARRNNPAFLASRNDEQVADWDVRAAWGSLLPFASASSGVSWQGAGEQRFGSLTAEQLGFGDQPSYYFSSYSLGLSYSLDGAALLAPAEAGANRRATVARIDVAERQLELAVKQAYLHVLREDEVLRLARQELERARFNLRLASGRQEVGSASMLDVRQAEIAVGRAEVAVLQSESALRTARLRLLQQIGVDLDLEPVLVTDFELFEPPWEREELTALALEENPELAALRANRVAAGYQVRSARSAYLPSLTFQAGWSGFTREASDTRSLELQDSLGHAGQVQQCQALNELFVRLADPLPPQDCSVFAFGPGDRAAIRARNDAFPLDFTRQPPQASLTFNIPIFQGLQRQRQIEEAQVQRDDLEHRLREQELALGADLGANLAAVELAYEAARIEERNQGVADEQRRLALEQYRLGSISFLELVEAETVKAQADRDLLGAVFTFHENLASLEALVGTALRDR